MEEVDEIEEQIRTFWECVERSEGVHHGRQANNPAQVSPGSPWWAEGDGAGTPPLPGLPRAFLAYQLNPKRGTVIGGGRGGPAGSTAPKAPLPPPTDREAR